MASVVGEIYCNPYTTELVVKRRRVSLYKDIFEVFDLSGNLIFTADGGLWNLRRDRVLRDPTGLPLLSLRTKGIIRMRYKWEVYKGESKEADDLLLYAREPNLWAFKTLLDVYLPQRQQQQYSNTNIHNIQLPNFRTSGRFMTSAFKLFQTNNNTMLAEVVHDLSWGGLIKGNYSFKVKVNPYVDFAFVVALLIIADDTANLR